MKKLLPYLLLFLTSSCARTINIDILNKGNMLNPKSQVIQSSAIVSTNSNEVIVDKTKTTTIPAVGDIIIAEPGKNNEYGILSKVISFTNRENQLIYKTEPAGLNEAFDQLEINNVYKDSFSENENLRTTGSISISFSDDNSIVNGLKFNGTLKVNIPEIQIEYKKSTESSMPEKVLLRAEINTEGSSLEIANTASESFELASERTIKTFNLPNITIPIPIATPIGPIVLPLILTQKLKINILPIALSGKIQWTTLPVISGTLGAKFENGAWSNISTYSGSASEMSLNTKNVMPALSLSANATLFNPVYEIAPYGSEMLKGYFEVPNSVSIDLQTETPNINMSYKMDVTGGIKTKFWTAEENNFSITGNAVEKKIYEGDWVNINTPILAFSGVNNCKIFTGDVGSSFVLTFKVKDSFKILSSNNWQLVEQVGAQQAVSFSASLTSNSISYKGCLRFGKSTAIPMALYLKTTTGIKSNQISFSANKPSGSQ